mmetsp:Transcript_17937/g.27729  ORF Transcript_17937/g.27729 Transcript_17937/m.27729 type:complete len:241 (-) Transcript_17937:408-1130(-)
MIRQPKKVVYSTAETMLLLLFVSLFGFSSAQTSAPSPESPNHPYCNPCGFRMAVGEPENVVSIPTVGTFTCGQLDLRSMQGFVPRANCRMFQAFTSGERCGCVPKTPKPTPAPTSVPTSSPSISIAPSGVPSESPSELASNAPSEQPTISPSVSPTISGAPTIAPSPVPSEEPTAPVTPFPTFSPSRMPSISEAPSMSGMPTDVPVAGAGEAGLPIRTRNPAAEVPGLRPVRGWLRGAPP